MSSAITNAYSPPVPEHNFPVPDVGALFECRKCHTVAAWAEYDTLTGEAECSPCTEAVREAARRR